MTYCPICKTTALKSAYLENDLPVLTCSSCGGMWLRANEYAHWLKSQTPGVFDESKVAEASQRLHVSESDHAATCPDCGHFLRRYRVSARVDFHLDRCNNCNGVWLDKNEWEALKAADLHDEINKILTQPWQRHIDDETTFSRYDGMYRERFGADDYEKIKEIRKWLAEHPNRNSLIAFLLDKNPYSS
ncbi:MAG TPA: zf-TFIIB domain-containing protein [Anaerolineaceae bacterium]|nr:zf-TFIIB domain-containing protein [Anaerolineaceae bacterium]HQH86953.1 zf-TFIIB domain-containing protein [Anaerolineaceae bacterium]